jgi:hypothetical protein
VLDHVLLGVADVERSRWFYDAVLRPHCNRSSGIDWFVLAVAADCFVRAVAVNCFVLAVAVREQRSRQI